MVLRVGVLGGTFDPIHIGHLAAAEDAACLLRLNTVLFLPNKIPPHKHSPNVTSVEHRVAMTELAVKDNPHFRLSLIELERDGSSYTLDTLRLLRDRYRESHSVDVTLLFLTGIDSLRDLHTWNNPEELLREFDVVFMNRPLGDDIDWEEAETHFPAIRERTSVVRIAQLDISSRDIRERVRTHRPIRYYVLPVVESYIHDHGLYTERAE
ncbi:MAG: nicotinate-nucleotide adenylyltransferase [Chloroflexota bacterium]